ncbi:MAG: DUF6089 family protein [Crocinitomicaceae bacterium]
MAMKTRLVALFACFLLVSASDVNAQYATGASRSELGVMVGGTYYIGDINRFMPYRNTHLSGGLIYRFNLHPRAALRANFLYGKLSGEDSDSNLDQQIQRNLSFNTTIWELAGGIEFNYFPFQIGNDRYRGTAYLLAEIGLFRMNPKAIGSNGNEVDLQPLGTEGQGTSLSDRNPYNLTQLTIPLGLGVKLSIGEKASLNFEVGLRKTFTDYIDDIGSDSYVDPDLLAAENGPLSAEMSNMSLNNERFGRRGDASTKDWYVFSGVMFTFRLGKPANCMPH